MNKRELINVVAEVTDSSKREAAIMVDAVIGSIAEELVDGGKVSLVGFGTFESVLRNERKCRNLQTGEDMIVPAKMAPKFRPSKSLKDAVAEIEIDSEIDAPADLETLETPEAEA